MARNLVTNLKFKKNRGTFDPEKFAKMIDDAYIGNKNEPKYTKKTTFSPSTLGYGHGNCPRYWYIAFDGAEFISTNDALSIANMENGTAAHERIQDKFKKTGTVVALEKEMLKTGPPIRGFSDAIINWEDVKNVVAEIKTTKDSGYLFRQNSMSPSQNHLLQILIYMDIEGLDEGFLYYENKDNQEVLIIPVSMNEANRKFLEECYEWMREVHKSWVDRELPQRPYRKNNSICKDCPVRATCFDMEDTEKLVPTLKL